jgi:hypothetical protein
MNLRKLLRPLFAIFLLGTVSFLGCASTGMDRAGNVAGVALGVESMGNDQRVNNDVLPQATGNPTRMLFPALSDRQEGV